MSDINFLSFLREKKGISVLYAVFIASVLLAIGLGLSTILIQQIKMMRGIGYSVVAFCAADSGLEMVLLNRDNPSNIDEIFLPNGASYQVQVTAGGEGDCPGEFYFCIKSIGNYQETSRAIEINY